MRQPHGRDITMASSDKFWLLPDEVLLYACKKKMQTYHKANILTRVYYGADKLEF